MAVLYTKNQLYYADHIYRAADLDGADAFLDKEDQKIIVKGPSYKLTLSMIVKNESERYLREVLKEHRKYIHEAVIIDDGSTDNTAELCQELLEGIPVHLIRNEKSKFSNEIELRKQQWTETLKTKPEWILNLDTDELFEKNFNEEISNMLTRKDLDVYCFRLYDFWDESHYRDDSLWRAHRAFRPFLIRYRNDFEYKWKETPQHCGRFPANIFELPNAISTLRLKLFGWLQLDPEAIYGDMAQYESILDKSPNLVRWEE